MNSKLAVVIQARLGSSRLPEKMLLDFNGVYGLLEFLITRLKVVKQKLIIATTTNPNDDLIVDLAEKFNIDYYRGEENNVLKRFLDLGDHFELEKIVRVCADNPFLDIDQLSFLIDDFMLSDADYWCHCMDDFTPSIKTHFGFWAEGVSTQALRKVKLSTDDLKYQEHVTNYIYENEIDFNIHYQKVQGQIEKHGDIRLTIDTKDDFDLLKEINNQLNRYNVPYNYLSIINFVSRNPKWLSIMRETKKSNSK